jgi:hypothetical protein
MNDAQESAWASINDRWPIATTGLMPDGTVSFTCDNGDTGVIYENRRLGVDHMSATTVVIVVLIAVLEVLIYQYGYACGRQDEAAERDGYR